MLDNIRDCRADLQEILHVGDTSGDDLDLKSFLLLIANNKKKMKRQIYWIKRTGENFLTEAQDTQQKNSLATMCDKYVNDTTYNNSL